MDAFYSIALLPRGMEIHGVVSSCGAVGRFKIYICTFNTAASCTMRPLEKELLTTTPENAFAKARARRLVRPTFTL